MRSYNYPLLKKSDICERFILWIVLTPDLLLEHRTTLFQVVISRYAQAFNKSTNNKYLSTIGELNPKDRPDK